MRQRLAVRLVIAIGAFWLGIPAAAQRQTPVYPGCSLSHWGKTVTSCKALVVAVATSRLVRTIPGTTRTDCTSRGPDPNDPNDRTTNSGCTSESTPAEAQQLISSTMRLAMPDGREIELSCDPIRPSVVGAVVPFARLLDPPHDCLAPANGTEVTLEFVGDAKTIHVSWSGVAERVKSISKSETKQITLKETYRVVEAAHSVTQEQ